jgi:hypothetical protein
MAVPANSVILLQIHLFVYCSNGPRPPILRTIRCNRRSTVARLLQPERHLSAPCWMRAASASRTFYARGADPDSGRIQELRCLAVEHGMPPSAETSAPIRRKSSRQRPRKTVPSRRYRIGGRPAVKGAALHALGHLPD